jgi:hypothetical protein
MRFVTRYRSRAAAGVKVDNVGSNRPRHEDKNKSSGDEVWDRAVKQVTSTGLTAPDLGDLRGAQRIESR